MDTGHSHRKKLLTGNFICVYLRLSAVAVIALVAAGCADLRWHKPGTDPATLEEDLGQCRMDARMQAGRETLPRPLTSPPMIGADAKGNPVVVQSSSRDTDRLLREQDLTRICMRGKGYALAPVEKR